MLHQTSSNISFYFLLQGPNESIWLRKFPKCRFHLHKHQRVSSSVCLFLIRFTIPTQAGNVLHHHVMLKLKLPYFPLSRPQITRFPELLFALRSLILKSTCMIYHCKNGGVVHRRLGVRYTQNRERFIRWCVMNTNHPSTLKRIVCLPHLRSICTCAGARACILCTPTYIPARASFDLCTIPSQVYLTSGLVSHERRSQPAPCIRPR